MLSKYDRDQSGWIDATELKIMVEDLGEPVSDLEVQRLVKKLDKNNDGTIGFEEFMEWFLCRCPACKYIMERDPILKKLQKICFDNRRLCAMGSSTWCARLQWYGAISWHVDLRFLSGRISAEGSCSALRKMKNGVGRSGG